MQIGSGGWGDSWLEYISNNGGCELAGMISRGGANLENAKRKYGLKDSQCHTSAAEGLKAPADLVIVTVPHPWHIEYAKMAVEAGKNVLIEKPLSNDFGKAREFAAFLKGRDEKVWVSQNYRFRKNLWDLKASLGESGVGNIAWMDVLFRYGSTSARLDPANEWERASWRDKQFSLLLEEIAIHHFDIMRFLTGSNARLIDCKGFSPYWNDLNGVECVFANIELENGAYVNYSSSMKAIGLNTGWMGSYTVQTDKGAVYMTESEIRYEPGRDEKGGLKAAPGFPGTDRDGVLNELKKGVVGGECAVPTIFDNLNSYAMVCAAEISAAENRPVELDELL